VKRPSVTLEKALVGLPKNLNRFLINSNRKTKKIWQRLRMEFIQD